jgi:hypothetical protein
MTSNNRRAALLLLHEKLEVLLSKFLELEFIDDIMPNELNFPKCPPKMRIELNFQKCPPKMWIYRCSSFTTGIS